MDSLLLEDDKILIVHPPKEIKTFWDHYTKFNFYGKFKVVDVFNYVLMHSHNKVISINKMKHILYEINLAIIKETGKPLITMSGYYRFRESGKGMHLSIKELLYLGSSYTWEFLRDMTPLQSIIFEDEFGAVGSKVGKGIRLVSRFDGGILEHHELINIIIDELVDMSLCDLNNRLFNYK